jgi:hypothetical protein
VIHILATLRDYSETVKKIGLGSISFKSKKLHFKLRWSKHLEIGINHNSDEGLITYIELKFLD